MEFENLLLSSLTLNNLDIAIHGQCERVAENAFTIQVLQILLLYRSAVEIILKLTLLEVSKATNCDQVIDSFF